MPLSRKLFLAVVPLLISLAPGLSNAHQIKFGSLIVVHPWLRQRRTGEIEGYMRIANQGTEDDRLVGAAADVSNKVILCDARQGASVPLTDGIPIPAGRTVELSSKSFHIMFLDVDSAPFAGTEFGGTLTFAKAGALKVDFEVEEPE